MATMWAGGGAALPTGSHPGETDACPLEFCDLRRTSMHSNKQEDKFVQGPRSSPDPQGKQITKYTTATEGQNWCPERGLLRFHDRASGVRM